MADDPPAPDSTAPWTWWRERRLPAAGLHLDSAAAGRSSRATLAAAAAHAEREATEGAYVAMAEVAPVLAAGQAALATLLAVPPAGLAFVSSAEAGLEALLRIWPLAQGDTVAVARCEWGPNLNAFAARGLAITEISAGGDGAIDLAALEHLLASAPPALVHLTQVTSHRGLVQPVAQAAALCRAAGVPLWVDAAQALGHVDTACGADAVYVTSRKWLTGPRGVGAVGIAEPWWDRLRIQASDLAVSSRPAGTSPVWLLNAGEASIAAWVGLCQAVREFTEAGPPAVWARLAAVGAQAREALTGLPGWAVADAPGTRSAIVALRPTQDQDVTQTRARLLSEHRIVTTACHPVRAPREMTGSLLRISPHVDTTPEDLSQLHAALS